MRAKVRAYYHYLKESRHGYQDRATLTTLPPTVRAKIFLALHAELIDRAPFFRGAERRSVEAIVLAFKPRVAAPSEILFRVGDPVDALYVIQRDAVDILTATGAVIATLHSRGSARWRCWITSRATVRATDDCDLLVLDQEAFELNKKGACERRP